MSSAAPGPLQPPSAFAAVDLGATSGRVVVGHVTRESLTHEVVHRFPNTPVRLPDGLHWDVLGLYREVLAGLRQAALRQATLTPRGTPLVSVGIDSWAVDYGLLDADGTLVGAPFHYRDRRTEGAADAVWRHVDAAELYRVTGLQHLPFNTVFQLAAARESAALARARHLLLLPDLLTYWLTGTIGAETTNASTTGLFDAPAGEWSRRVTGALGLAPSLLPPLRPPGSPAGELLPHVLTEVGLSGGRLPVTAVASHDTASAVAAVPALDGTVAYISCGTWSLAGLELERPVLTEAARRANFSNERGVDGTIRFLRNIMGMWLLEECRRAWAREDGTAAPADHTDLIAQAEAAPAFAAVIDPDAPDFAAAGDVPARIAAFCRRTGQQPPRSRGSVVRTVLEALALAHARTLTEAAELTGRELRTVHLVGGGARNGLLCQLTADALGLPVVAGPVEATALGNILVQARAHGVLESRQDLRRLVADTQPLRRYDPSGSPKPWQVAAARLGRT
ncbi:rhamnulokinase [Streptacidiphilus anmyonensis]|uniref:rhamnulokinase n=1 Tax=Streptacidiphilus anmyonensis TaxID=405782 RepID=UPI0005AA8FEC|nr:rhamnulokinase family protein [Streptacidiphilus anmyonensis]